MAKQKPATIRQADADAQTAQHLELLADMGRDFASSRDIDVTLLLAVERITRHLDAAGGAVFLSEDSGETLRCHACWGATEITGLTLPRGQGIVGRCVERNRGEIVQSVTDDPAFYGGVDDMTGFETKSILCAPMNIKGEALGAIELINKQSGDGRFDDEDLLLLKSLGTSAALALLNARMAEALVEQERARRELELAAEIQRNLLPPAPGGTFPVQGVNVPARTVSGDFYDFFPLDGGRICFTLGDVSGKGINAAMLMAKTASIFRCLGKTIQEPGRLLARVNNEIYETVTRGMFVTMIGGIYDPATGIVRFANAGHEPPLFHDRTGTFTDLPAEAPPLGIAPLLGADNALPETELRLDGGTLYVFTDGVSEGYQEDGSVLAVDGFKDLIRDSAALPLEARLDAVVEHLCRGEGALRDDVTLLAIEDMERKARDKDTSTGEAAADGAGDGVILSLRFPSHAERLKPVRDAVREALNGAGCAAPVVRDIVIAIDEACQNIIRHAYGHGVNGDIVLDIRRSGADIVTLLRDFAEPVDTGKIKPRDLDDLRPGGLGTHFMREVMDELEFLPSPCDGGNLLRMVKRVE